MKERDTFPLALQPPQEEVVVVTHTDLDRAIRASQQSPRKRIIWPLHKSDSSTLHRMFNVLQPDTYIRAHWHRHPPKDESLIVLQGAICTFIFDDVGHIQQQALLRADSDAFGIDIAAGICHSFVVLETDTVIFEVKPGPYNPQSDKDFAEWAPTEDSAQAKAFLARLCERIQA
jgi:cupin fold WbuC family metalloprotein